VGSRFFGRYNVTVTGGTGSLSVFLALGIYRRDPEKQMDGVASFSVCTTMASPSGLKRLGEIFLALQFLCSSCSETVSGADACGM
jgi:hypothetical protein